MKLVVKLLIVWIISMILFFAWGYFFSSLKPSLNKIIADIAVVIDIIVGVIAFGMTILFTFLAVIRSEAKVEKKHTQVTKKIASKNVFKKLFKIVLLILFLPIYVLYKVIKDKSKLYSKIIKFFVVLCMVSPIYFGIELVGLAIIGLAPIPNQIAGHSMLPTLKDGEYITWILYRAIPKLFYSLHRGDLVTYSYKKPDGQVQAQVKRVIGLPSDKIRIETGYVYINDNKLDEPYLEQQKSTYGGSFISDCKEIEVPKDTVFVMGDNRKRSSDSREGGFVSLKDIISFLPQPVQFIYTSRYHKFPQTNVSEISLDKSKYYELLNKYREEHKLGELKANTKLEKVSEIIIQEMFKRNETPLKMTSDDETLALSKAGYYNTRKNYIFGLGYYDAEELLKYFEMAPQTNEPLLNSVFDDTGIAVLTGKLNNCETQIVLQSFGGYVPPNYSKSDIDSWKKSLEGLNSILPSWENLKNYSLSYNQHKQEIDRLLDIIHIRISRIQQIVGRMENNQWFTTDENNWIKEEQVLFNEQESIAKKLNSSFSWQH